MRVLYLGDVMGEVGIEVVEKVLPQLKQDRSIDVVIAQAENVTAGKSMSVADYQRLKAAGVDGFSGGNHTITRPEIFTLLNDVNAPVTGPANIPDCPGPGYKYIPTPKGRVLMVSLLGKVVGRDAEKLLINPLKKIDEILATQKDEPHVATVVNFHGDYSSEKVVIGHYLDGWVTAVIGDHWHIPTADARVLPGGTAHQTDVGMCGALESSLGVAYDSIIKRWHDDVPTKNILETAGPRQFCALLVEADETTGLAKNVEAIREILPS